MQILSVAVRFIGVELTAGTGGVLLGGEGDLVQHELGDWVGEGGCHGQKGRLWLVTVLIGDKLDFDGGAVRGGVAVKVKK